jgi:hypothetical protein
MADFDWPATLARSPWSVAFYLRPNTGGATSPFTGSQKVYNQGPPRWVAKVSVRGGDGEHWGDAEWARYGPELDAFLSRVKGRGNRIRLWDFRRPGTGSTLVNEDIFDGATSVVVSGGVPKVGDYIGGDGRPHHFTVVTPIGGGRYSCEVEPPFLDDVPAGAATFERVTGLFRLTSDESGANTSPVGQLTHYELELEEDLDFFHPKELITADDDGYMFDFSNPMHVFKSTNLVAPVEADGDAVGFVRDLSGKGNHGGVSSAANRPRWKQSPHGLRGLYFDGVDDILYLSKSVVTAAGFTVVMCAQVLARDTANSQVFWGETSILGDGLYYMATATGRSAAADDDATAKLRISTRNNAGTSTTLDSDEAFADDNPRILTLRDDALTFGSFIDNREEPSTATRAGALTLGQQAIGALAEFDGLSRAFFTECFVYGLFAINRPLSDSELARVQAWMARRYLAPMRQAEGVSTLPVLPQAVMFHGRRVAGTITQSAGVRVTELEFDGDFRGRAYSPWSMGEVAGDAHSAPALVPLSDGRLFMGWTGHNFNAWIRTTTSDSLAPADWAAPRHITPELGVGNPGEWTYFSAAEMATGLFIFMRWWDGDALDTNQGYWYATSTDPATDPFDGAVKFIQSVGNARPYIVWAKRDPWRVYFQVTSGHPAEETDNSVWGCYLAIDPSDGSVGLYDLDDNELTMPAAPSDMTLIHDGSSDLAWIGSVAIGSDGHPRFTYEVYDDVGGYVFWHARWTGSAIVASPIASDDDEIIAGTFYATGNAMLDPDDPTIVYVGRLEPPDTVHQIWRYTTDDNGLTWTGERITNEPEQCFAPHIIEGAPEPRLLYTTGPFDDEGGVFVGDTRVRLANSVTGEPTA